MRKVVKFTHQLGKKFPRAALHPAGIGHLRGHPAPLPYSPIKDRRSERRGLQLTVDHQHRLKSRPEIWKSGCCCLLTIGDTTMGRGTCPGKRRGRGEETGAEDGQPRTRGASVHAADHRVVAHAKAAIRWRLGWFQTQAMLPRRMHAHARVSVCTPLQRGFATPTFPLRARNRSVSSTIGHQYLRLYLEGGRSTCELELHEW
jgi:hypothetical protein